MDCTKVGRQIALLRKEKQLTQQDVADMLHISNKTVSKWECGLGLPDVSLWTDLSAVLGVDLERMLLGEMEPNRPDIGKMELVRFYVCPTCGNILISTGDAAISCCGRKLAALRSLPLESGLTVSVEEMDADYHILMNHEMSKEHYIAFAAYARNDRVHLNRLYPEQSAETRVPIMQRGGSLYLYCTQHGLQRVLIS